MPSEVPYNAEFNPPLSEKIKKELGIDSASFMKRMLARLKKIRGEDSDTDTFLSRHNYQLFNERLG